MPAQRGILGMKKDPKKQLLFSFNVRKGDEWPSSDSDSDYLPSSDDDTPSTRKKQSKPSTKTSSKKRKTSSTSKSQVGAHKSRKPSRLKRPKQTSQSSLDPSTKVKTSSAVGASKGDKCDALSRVATDGDSHVPQLPPELWLKIFRCHVNSFGPLPFLCRAARVCAMWRGLACHPSLWTKVDLSYGWIKSKDQTLQWLAQHRLSQCREISLDGWKFLTNEGIKVLCKHCSTLELINLSHCTKLTSLALTMLTEANADLRELDLSFMGADATSSQSLTKVVKKVSSHLTSFSVVGNSLTGFNVVLNALMDNCPSLDTLDLSICTFSTDYLSLDVERLQRSCPNLRVLRLANCKIRPVQLSRGAQLDAPGFKHLEELSCATPASSNDVSDDLLGRLLENADKLQLLDLRGCTSFNLSTLLAYCAPHTQVEQLFLSQSCVSQPSSSLRLAALLTRWGNSLRTLDLAWTTPSEKSLHDALKALVATPHCPLTHLNLAGSTVSLKSVRLVLKRLRHLESLDLTSCRSMPRGTKCLHPDRKALAKLKTNLLNDCDSDDTDSY